MSRDGLRVLSTRYRTRAVKEDTREAVRKADLGNIKYFRPTGEPDADYDTYKDYI